MGYTFDVAYGVGKAAVDRLAADMSKELHDFNIACVSLWPGAVATEYLISQGNRLGDVQFAEKDMESPEFTSQGVVALASDAGVMEKSGGVFQCAELAKEYGYTDTDKRSKAGLVPSYLVDKFLPSMRPRRAKNPGESGIKKSRL